MIFFQWQGCAILQQVTYCYKRRLPSLQTAGQHHHSSLSSASSASSPSAMLIHHHHQHQHIQTAGQHPLLFILSSHHHRHFCQPSPLIFSNISLLLLSFHGDQKYWCHHPHSDHPDLRQLHLLHDLDLEIHCDNLNQADHPDHSDQLDQAGEAIKVDHLLCSGCCFSGRPSYSHPVLRAYNTTMVSQHFLSKTLLGWIGSQVKVNIWDNDDWTQVSRWDEQGQGEQAFTNPCQHWRVSLKMDQYLKIKKVLLYNVGNMRKQ